MATVSRSALDLALRCVFVLLGGFAGAAQAATLVATPAKGNAGTSVRLEATGLAPTTSYTLEFVGNPATTIATLTTSAAGTISTVRVLPALPPGGGKLRLRTGPFGGTVVAYTAFTALPSMSFAPLASTVHAGQSIK